MHDPDSGGAGKSPFQTSGQFRIALHGHGTGPGRGQRRSDYAVPGTQVEDQIIRVDISLSDQPRSQGAGKEVRTLRCGRRRTPSPGHGSS